MTGVKRLGRHLYLPSFTTRRRASEMIVARHALSIATSDQDPLPLLVGGIRAERTADEVREAVLEALGS